MQFSLCADPKAYQQGQIPIENSTTVVPYANYPSSNSLIRWISIAKSTQNKFSKHLESCSFRGIARTNGLAITVVSLVRTASHRARQGHHAQVNAVETDEVFCRFHRQNTFGKVRE